MTLSDQLISHLDYLNTLEGSSEVSILEKLINIGQMLEIEHLTHLNINFEDSSAFFKRVLNSEQVTLSAYDSELLKIICKVAQNRIDHLKDINRLRKSERVFRLTFEQMGSGMCQTDLKGYILEANEKFCDIIGYKRDEIMSLCIKNLTHPDDWEIDIIYKNQLFNFEIPYFSLQKRYFRKDGSMIWVYTTVTIMRGDAMEPDFLIGVVQDISTQKAAEAVMRDHNENLEKLIQTRTSELESLNAQLIEADRLKDLVIKELNEVKEKLLITSNSDPLTGLYNRRFMMARITDEMNRFKRNKTPFCVILSDIDLFKDINDRFGHDGGDEVLLTISKILTDEIRNIDTLSRWGGEEFLILLPESQLQPASQVAERIRKHISEQSFSYEGTPFRLTMTFGVAMYEDHLSIKELIKKADEALYQGKLSGRNCVV